MDPDVVVQYLTRGLVLLGASLVAGALAAWLAGRVCRRAGVGSGLTLAAQILTPLALLYGASLYLDVAGSVADARVVSIDERISYRARPPGTWSRSFWATTTFGTADGPRQALLWIDADTYDALQPGLAIRVRYLPWLPLIARPADQSTLAFVPLRLVVIAAAVVGAVIVLRPLWRRAPALSAFAAFVALLGAVVWWVFPTPWVPPLEPPVLTAIAEVREVREVTQAFVSGRSAGHVPAPQPWQLVELRFVPAGRDRLVAAMDGVDVGSAPGLQPGARVAIRYSATNPREAQLAAGARTWRWREWRELLEYAAVTLGLLGLVVLLVKGAGIWWRRTTTSS